MDRVNEITTLGEAIGQLEKQNEEFSDELRGQLSISADPGIEIISYPVTTAAGLAEQFADNLNETLTGVSAEHHLNLAVTDNS